MSSYVVNKMHIDALISWAGQQPDLYYWHDGEVVMFAGNETEIGQKLVDQNVRSVAHCYSIPDHDPEAQSYLYSWTPFRKVLKPVEVIKACRGYSYQANETDDWEETPAHAIIEAIMHKAISVLPGYEEAGTWEITERTQFLSDKNAVQNARPA